MTRDYKEEMAVPIEQQITLLYCGSYITVHTKKKDQARGLKASHLMNFSHSRFVQVFKHSFLLVCSNFNKVPFIVNSNISLLYYFCQRISILFNTKYDTEWSVEQYVCFGSFSCLHRKIKWAFCICKDKLAEAREQCHSPEKLIEQCSSIINVVVTLELFRHSISQHVRSQTGYILVP